MSNWRVTFQDDSGLWMRTCCKCGETKPLETDFYKSKGGKTLCHRYNYNCRVCEKLRRRNTTTEFRRREAERRKREVEADRQKERERHKRYREKLKADPARYTVHLENRRISEHLRREKAGVLRLKFQPAKMAKVEEHLLPAKPLYLAARTYVERRQGEGYTVGEACQTLGITDREYRRWVTGEQTKVRFETADKLLTAMRLHWWDVWDEDEVPERMAA